MYLARDPNLPRSNALKVLSPELSRDPDFRARFIREADVASSLEHPNIVSIHRRGEFEGQLWIAMQFVNGTDADAALRAGTMTAARTVHVIGEVGKALDYAHQRGVVHRDVKPANFLLSGPVGPDERVLLGDFGIARALDDVGLTVAPARPVTSAALSGLLLSPEQVAGLVGADALVQESFADTMIDDSQKVVEKDCIGVAAPDQHLVYADSGWAGARSQALRNAGEGPRAFAIIQAVIAFPSVEQAKKLVAAQESQWTSCSGQTLSLVFPAPPSPQRWTVGTPNDTDGTLKMTQELKDGGGMKCQRALAAHNNVAIDVSACRYDVTNQAADIVNAIAAKIPH